MHTIYFDGGAAPNPGKMHVCVLIQGIPYFQQLGHGTNNIAEWTALCWGLLLAECQGLKEIEIIGDSQLIVNQANGLWKIKQAEFLPFKEEFDRLIKSFDTFTLKFERRKHNLAGHHIEKFLKSRS